MDEPCSALDPISTLVIEDLIDRAQEGLHRRHRHPQHAAGGPGLGHHRVHDHHRCRRARSPGRGRPNHDLFSSPAEQATVDYITRKGRMTRLARTQHHGGPPARRPGAARTGLSVLAGRLAAWLATTRPAGSCPGSANWPASSASALQKSAPRSPTWPPRPAPPAGQRAVLPGQPGRLPHHARPPARPRRVHRPDGQRHHLRRDGHRASAVPEDVGHALDLPPGTPVCCIRGLGQPTPAHAAMSTTYLPGDARGTSPRSRTPDLDTVLDSAALARTADAPTARPAAVYLELQPPPTGWPAVCACARESPRSW